MRKASAENRPTSTSTDTTTGVAQEVVNENYTIIRMVNYGFTTHAIAEKTGLTHGQVQGRVQLYRLQGIRGNYRHGRTEEAKTMIETVLTVPKKQRVADCGRFQRIRDTILHARRIAAARARDAV